MTDTPNDTPGEYEVGYGKPPKSGQFKPGQSGNPKGRPKASPNSAEAFRREGRRMVTFRSGDRVEKITKDEMIWRQMYQAALKGDMRAAMFIVQYDLKLSQANNNFEQETAVDTGDVPVMGNAEALELIKTRLSQIQSEENS